MKVIEDIQTWRKLRPTLAGSMGFVPTMGALHDGHASLLRASKGRDDITVLSIYVNPTQFNEPKDLADYPDTLAEDLAVAEEIGVDYVIMPAYAGIYSDGYRYQVTENDFSNELCGANRPGHFTGVLTVVMKLLNLVRPQRAYFGKKDYQQYLLVRDMVETFFMDVEIVGCETVRECDGLAMSSRNKLLTADARRVASKFNRALRSPRCDEEVGRALADFGFAVDYIETRGERRFGAIVVDCGDRSVRLIDNVEPSEVA
jgi:pantoate--beta-alanine ligase